MSKKILIPALALAAATVAMPAAAQSYNRPHHNGPAYTQNYGGWQSLNVRRANLDRRIDMGVRNGSLSRREATSLRAQFNGLLRLEANYRRGGLTAWERQDLDRRYDRLSAQIRSERHDWNDRRNNRRH